jgi:cholesterol transport system auxiliary component
MVFLSACSFGPVNVAPETTYSLNQTPILTPSKTPSSATLMVMHVNAIRGFDSANMMYQKAPYELASFAKNAWLSPPASMMTPLIIKAMQDSNLFQAVVLGPSLSNTTYVLNASLLGLYQDFTVTPSEEVLRLDVSLTNGSTLQLIADQIITERVPAKEENPYGGVVAANQAMSNALIAMTQFVASHGMNGVLK